MSSSPAVSGKSHVCSSCARSSEIGQFVQRNRLESSPNGPGTCVRRSMLTWPTVPQRIVRCHARGCGRRCPSRRCSQRVTQPKSSSRESGGGPPKAVPGGGVADERWRGITLIIIMLERMVRNSPRAGDRSARLCTVTARVCQSPPSRPARAQIIGPPPIHLQRRIHRAASARIAPGEPRQHSRHRSASVRPHYRRSPPARPLQHRACRSPPRTRSVNSYALSAVQHPPRQLGRLAQSRWAARRDASGSSVPPWPYLHACRSRPRP